MYKIENNMNYVNTICMNINETNLIFNKLKWISYIRIWIKTFLLNKMKMVSRNQKYFQQNKGNKYV